MTQNAKIAEATLAHLIGLGVRDFIVCAGARNVPLVASLLKLQDDHDLQVYHHFDERTASFFAMGMAKTHNSPAAVLTTSGTAVAELLPSTIESFYAGIPLVLVTSDRPSAFRGSGAPQAIEQLNLFRDFVTGQFDITEISDLREVSGWDRKSPLHLNVCFGEPGGEDTVTQVVPVEFPVPDSETSQPDREALENFVSDPAELMIFLGELPYHWQKPVARLLEKLRVPFWAEATSGLREMPALSLFRVPFEKCIQHQAPGKVLRIGGVPSLRFWRDLEDRTEIEVLSISPQPFSGLARSSRHLAVSDFPMPSRLIAPPVTKQGQVSDTTLLDELFLEFPNSEPAMVRSLSGTIAEDALIFLGNSLPIREWNLAATFGKPHPRVFASRGANGIDGQISSFLGMSRGEEESWGVFGDLTTLYDLSAPALLEQIPQGKRRIVVINNGGGRIFSRLPSMAGLGEEEKKVTENRHQISFQSWAGMWGMDYVSWEPDQPFPVELGPNVVLEILPDERETEAFWQRWK